MVIILKNGLKYEASQISKGYRVPGTLERHMGLWFYHGDGMRWVACEDVDRIEF